MKTVDCATGRCGSGKTLATLTRLATQQQVNPNLTLWASLTRELSKKSFEFYNSQLPNKALLVDSSTVSCVQSKLTDLVLSGYDGVIFVTHNALLNESLDGVLGRSNVICDEIPTSSIELLQLTQTNDTFHVLLEFCEFNQCRHSSAFQTVSLKENCSIYDKAVRIVDNHRKTVNADKTYSKELINILDFLIKGYTVTYYSANKEDGKDQIVLHKFQAVHSKPAERLIEQSAALTILGSNLDSSMFGLLAKNKFNCNIVEHSSIGGTELEQKHKHKARIIPYLLNADWSDSIKRKSVHEALENRLTENKHSVREDIQIFAANLLGSDYLLFANESDSKHLIHSVRDYQSKGVEVLSTQVHGLNTFRHYEKACFMAAANPKPDELKLLGVASHDLGLLSKDMVNAVVTERYLEASYQCIARTAIRNLSPTEQEHVFIVPDMRSAKYIANRFESGSCTIDTSHGYNLIKKKREVSRTVKDILAEKRLSIVKSVLLDKQAKVGPMADILKKHSIHRNTFEKYKKEFKSHLIEIGLLKK